MTIIFYSDHLVMPAGHGSYSDKTFRVIDFAFISDARFHPHFETTHPKLLLIHRAWWHRQGFWCHLGAQCSKVFVFTTRNKSRGNDALMEGGKKI